MNIITTTKDLKSFCKKISSEPFITVDTEFVRDKTYYPGLCLIQVAGKDDNALIDVLSPDIDLDAFDKILLDKKIRKVMHGCRQDMEIFYKRLGKLPQNVFDTQIAAMVCGFHESISYEALVRKYTNGDIDKSHRFTDWTARPLSNKQLQYALGDVTHLYVIYEKMLAELKKANRLEWVEEEMKSIQNEDLYYVDPTEAWKRIKTKTAKGQFLAILKNIAEWREKLAQQKDVPRSRIMRDDILMQIAATAPKTKDKFDQIRGLSNGYVNSEDGKKLFSAVQEGLKATKADWPQKDKTIDYPSSIGPIVELLRVLLAIKSDEFNVAPTLLAGAEDLRQIAHFDKPDVAAMHGWRFDIFGRDALRLKNGELAIRLKNGKIQIQEF